MIPTSPVKSCAAGASLARRTRPVAVFLLALLLSYLSPVDARIFSPRIENCHTSSLTEDPTRLINFSTALAQVVPSEEAQRLGLNGKEGQDVIRIDLFGRTGQEIQGFDNATGKLATMFTETHDLNYNVWSTATYICNSLFPPSPLPEPYVPRNTTYCPLPAGNLGINISVPFSGSYGLSTLRTQVRIVDTAVPAKELSCINIDLSPYYEDAWYWSLLLWLPAGLAIGYWIAAWAARFAAGWVVGSVGDESTVEEETRQAAGIGSVVEVGADSTASQLSRKWGTMLVSGVSGERLGFSGALLRFITPGFRDVIWHLQFCAILAMIAVDWPEFAYPILAQGAWASLIWNVTLAQSELVDPLYISPENRFPANFRAQANDTAYPLYMDDNLPNVFLNYAVDGSTASKGIQRFAVAVGLRYQDLFGVCLVLFLAIAAAVIVLSLLFWTLMALVDFARTRKRLSRRVKEQTSSAVTPASGYTDADISARYKNSIDAYGPETPGASQVPHMHDRKGSGSTLLNLTGNSGTKRPSALKRVWARFKVKGPIGAFHWAALCGNLVRLIALFHLPITAFSCYQWSIGDFTSVASVVLAGLSFGFFSVALPLFLLYRIWRTPTAKLYDAMRTLLALGPMYNIYAQGNQLYYGFRFLASLVTGITVGVGQEHGLAQAIVLLVVEIVFGLGTTIWHPWRAGAGMVIPGFLFAMIRILSAALLVVMAPSLPIPFHAVGWIAYAILLLQGIALLLFLIMLVCKILEGLIRLFGKIRFDESTHPLDGGLFAAFGGLSEKLKGRRGSKRPRMDHRSSSNVGSINTQMMLNRYSTNPTTTAFSERPSHETYISGRHSMQWGDNNAIYSPVPDNEAPQEVLMDSAPTRGFSVVRGGRAAYQDPYAALPNANVSGRVTYPPNTRSLTSPDRRATFAPLPSVAENGSREAVVSPDGRPVRHARTRSQTAIIETFPSSAPDGPEGSMPGALGLAAPRPDRSSQSFSLHRGISGPVPLVLSYQQADAVPPASQSINSSQEEIRDAAPRKSNKPSTWFGRIKTNDRTANANSDSEEELVDYGRAGFGGKNQGHGGSSSSAGWLSSLLPGSASKRTSMESTNENAKSENSARKAATILLEGDNGSRQPISSEPPVRSFRVNRQQTGSSVSSQRPSPQSTNPNTPHAFGFSNLPDQNSPMTSERPQESQRSFAVNRGNRSAGGGSASSSRVTTPGVEGSPPFTAFTTTSSENRGTNVPAPPGRSFVVQRANQSSGNLAPPSASR